MSRVLTWMALVSAIAPSYGLDWRVALVLIAIESGGDPEAISPAGAVGLMQVMPYEAGESFSNRPPALLLSEPTINVLWGCSILRNNLRHFDGDYRRALAAYYMGIKGLERRGLDDPAVIRYLERFEKKWQEFWPKAPLPWEEVESCE